MSPDPLPAQKGTIDRLSINEINLVEHPFKQQMSSRVEKDYMDFDYHYFDDPNALTGFRGYFEMGSPAEGKRDFDEEARVIASIPGVRTALDVGCAKGFLVKALRRLGIESHGIDVSEYALVRTEREIRPYLKRMRVQDLQPVRQYDLIHVNGVFVYLTLSEIIHTLRVFHQMTKIGIMVIELTRKQLLKWYDRREISGLDPFRKQELSQDEWDRLIEGAGFRKSEFYYRKLT